MYDKESIGMKKGRGRESDGRMEDEVFWTFSLVRSLFVSGTETSVIA